MFCHRFLKLQLWCLPAVKGNRLYRVWSQSPFPTIQTKTLCSRCGAWRVSDPPSHSWGMGSATPPAKGTKKKTPKKPNHPHAEFWLHFSFTCLRLPGPSKGLKQTERQADALSDNWWWPQSRGSREGGGLDVVAGRHAGKHCNRWSSRALRLHFLCWFCSIKTPPAVHWVGRTHHLLLRSVLS